MIDAEKTYRLRAMKRFFDKTRLADNGCVEWTGSINIWGYGEFWYNRKLYRTHRISYMFANGINEIEKGKCVCHSCDNRCCVNPEHLWLGTQHDNLMDASRKKRISQQKITHCTKGHEYAGKNLLVDKNGHRKCRKCISVKNRNYKTKQTQPKTERGNENENGDIY